MKKQTRQNICDWELAQIIEKVMCQCDDVSLSERCDRIRAAGHEPRFMLGMSPGLIAKIVSGLILEDPAAKEPLFGIPENVKMTLRARPTELKRRMVAAKRGFDSKYIFSSLLKEPEGGQGYVVFRIPRTSRCIVYMLEWT